MREYQADLHIHTALSPCASPEMTPPTIVRAAVEAGLTLIAICDHNSARNVRAVQQAAAEVALPGGEPLTVLAGMEITTAEEVHVLGLFSVAEAAEQAGECVRKTLPVRSARSGVGQVSNLSRRQAENLPPQAVLDAEGQVVDIEDRLLSAASGFSLEQAVALVHSFDGLAVASHVDRPSFSVFSQLGLFPSSAGLDAVELSAVCVRDPQRARPFDRLGLAAITSSDSHFPSDIGFARTRLWLAEPSLAELRLALSCRDGRRWSR